MTSAGRVSLRAINARLYDQFSRSHARYQDTNRFMATLCAPAPGTAVVDLGCGTGATTAELLKFGDGLLDVTAVDAVPEMLDVAKGNLAGNSVRFVCGRGEDLDVLVGADIDLVVCNAAIWHMDAAAVARAVAKTLKPSGRFAFSLCLDNAGAQDCTARSSAMARLRAVLRRAVAERRAAGAILEGDEAPRRPPMTPRRLVDELAKHGLTVARVARTSTVETPESRRDFLRLPGVSYCLLPGVPYPERLRILDAAWDAAGWIADERVTWVYFVTQRREAQRT